MLSDYTPPSAKVSLGRKGEFEVKALDFDDLTILVSEFLPDLEKLWEMVSQIDPGARVLETAIILKVATEVPSLVGQIIALAARPFDPEATSMAARRLPFPTQVKAMETISRLTFEEFGGPKVFVAFVKTIIEKYRDDAKSLVNATKMMTTTEHPSNGSTEGSEAT